MPNRYKTIKQIIDDKQRVYITNPIYPEIPTSETDVYIITSSTDRYDILASEYYGDSSLWWIISSANPTSNQTSLIPTTGIQLRIPLPFEQALDAFRNLNENR